MNSVKVEQEEVIYPSSDGQPMAETPEHVFLMIALISALRAHFKPQRDVYVIGNVFLYYEKDNPLARRAPDIMIVKGVDTTVQRRSFKTWIEGKVPAVIFELTSSETSQEDRGPKRLLYERLGVREYFLFDPLSEYLPQQLIGYRLVGGRYEELKLDDDDGLISEELGLRLVPQGIDLAMIDVKSGQRLLVPEDAYELVEEQKQQAADAAEELQRMEQVLHAETHRAEQEKQRADALAAELAELRKQLRPPSS